MGFVIIALLLVAASALPTSQDYAHLYAMEERGLVPYLTPVLPPFSFAHIRALGQQYFSHVPAGQNATALSLVIYDWSQPHYIRIWLLQEFAVTAAPWPRPCSMPTGLWPAFSACSSLRT